MQPHSPFVQWAIDPQDQDMIAACFGAPIPDCTLKSNENKLQHL